MGGTTEDMYAAVRPYLEGAGPNSQGEQGLHCPLPKHEDRNRSASLNWDKGVWWCQVCQEGGRVESLVGMLNGGRPLPNGGRRIDVPVKQGIEKVSQSPVSDAQVLAWHEALLSDPQRYVPLTERRGLSLETLSEAMVGWCDPKRAYTIPVFDLAGSLQNVRYYDMFPKDDRRKIWSHPGYGEPILYPFYQMMNDHLVICEGEFDALMLIQHGFSAITRTGTADAWRVNWNRFFTGKNVWICHDMDDKGQRANDLVTAQLSAIARSVKVVTLPYDRTENHGADISDFFNDGGTAVEFLELLIDSPLVAGFGADDLPIVDELPSIDLSVLETFDASHYQDRIRLRATVVGKKYPTSMLPMDVHLSCGVDAGSKCTVCPVQGSAKIHYDEDDFRLLEFRGSTSSHIVELIHRDAKIPGKCPRVSTDISSLQSLEEIYVRPDIDTHRLSHEAADYTPRTIWAVGHHDSLVNATVMARGRIWPDPRDASNLFLADQLYMTTTNLDSFEMDEEKFDELRAFSTALDPLSKAVEVARELERHVTGIRGRTELHVLLDLAYHSILAFDLHGQRVQRGWLDVLVVGDTRTGKSEAATALLRHYGAGELVSGESASFAGIVGGLEQMGGKNWAIKWGVIPTNDRRLVVIDEVSGMTPDEIASMSSIRSAGEAVITKIQQERTLARTRLIWLGNPREARMNDFTYGVLAIKPLIGNNEDIARFDLAMSLRSGEVSLEEINRIPAPVEEEVYTASLCQNLVLWCWSRQAHHVVWADGVEDALLDDAQQLGMSFVDDPPLIQGENVRVKLARVAVALAARTFNSPDGEHLLVERRHVRGAFKFFTRLYGMRSFGYAAMSETRLASEQAGQQFKEAARQYLDTKPDLREFMVTNSMFKPRDLEEMLNMEVSEVRATINTLWGWHMLRNVRGMIQAQPALNEILREE